MSNKVKLTVESKKGTHEFEHEMVFFVAISGVDLDGKTMVRAESGLMGQGSAEDMGEAIADAVLRHPKGKIIAFKILSELLLDEPEDTEE